MRQVLSRKASPGSRISQSVSFPAPVRGWNDRDPLADMGPAYAVALDNFFPKPNYCEIRGGSQSYATGTTGNIKTLAVYNGLNGTNRMFAYTDSGIYETSIAGAVGASVLSRTNGKHQWIMFGDGTSSWLIAVNGIDKPAYFDGTTWTAVDAATSPALTGLDTTKIVSVFEFKGRLMFIEKDSLSFWYLAAGVAGGALTRFDLSGVAKKGGYLMAGATWTIDGGSGPDDRAVFITSEGEVIIYAGTNPSVATAWGLVGIFDLGKPLGRRCLQKFAGDIIALTQNGAYPLSAALQSASVDRTVAISDIIYNSFNSASRSYGNNFGWEAIIYRAQNALICNVPNAEDGTHEQYVMNTITKAWCKFTGWNAETFAVFNADLYFARGTAVYKAWNGTSDVGNSVIAYGKTAFSNFRDSGSVKRFNMFRPVLAANGNLSFLTDIDVDFRNTEINGSASYNSSSGAKWDVDNWDSASWAAGMEIMREWTSPDEEVGRYASGKVKIETNKLTVQWISCDWIYETGNQI